MCLAFSGFDPVRALIEFKLLNKKWGCNCCRSLNNSASRDNFSASVLLLSISFCSCWLYHNKLNILMLLISKNPAPNLIAQEDWMNSGSVSYTHLRAHETGRNLVCRLLLEKK